MSGKKAAADSKRVETALPEWSISLMRPLIGLGSKVFWRLEHKGIENIPSSGGLIIAANHQSYGDSFWLAGPIKRPIRFLAWSEAVSSSLVGKAIRVLGASPLNMQAREPPATCPSCYC